MYNKAPKNQAPNVNKAPRANILPVKPGKQFTGCLSFYRNTLSNTFKNIFDYYFSRMNLPFLKVKNETVALAIGCHPRTIQKATAHFKRDGIIFKSQTNPYAVNNFKVNISKSSSFAMLLNRQSKEVQERYMMTGQLLFKKDEIIVSQKKGIQSYSNINYIYNTTHKPTPRTRARDNSHNSVGYGVISKNIEEDKRSTRKLKVIEMLKEAQRQWFTQYRSDPRAKEMLERPDIKAQLFTPLISEIKSLLKLDDRETVKLIAVPDPALKYAYDYIKALLNGSKTIKKSVDDRMGWFMGIVKRFCNENKLKLDWHWYFTVCDILGMKAIETDEFPMPLDVEPVSGVTKPAAQYKTHSEAPQKPTISIGDEVLFVKSEIAKWELRLSDPVKYFVVEEYREFSVKAAQNDLISLRMRLFELETIH